MSREGGGLGGHMVQELCFGRQATAVFTPLVVCCFNFSLSK